MPYLKHLLWVLLAVLPLGVADPASAQNTVATDKAALVAFYTATDGANWTTSTNWNSVEPLSSWYGVTTNSDGRVTRLVLNNNGLDGTLPTALGDLSELEQLNLQDNALSGALPSELADLDSLQSLLLERSRALSGALPDGLRELTNLTSVRIQGTELCAPDTDDFQTWWGRLSSKSGLICPPTEQSVIDVAVFYTPAVRDAAGGTQAIEDEIDLMVAGTNTAYTNSGVNQRVNLVAVEEVDYTEVHSQTDLIRLISQFDGYMDEVHAIRDRVAADIVMLIRRQTDFAGGRAELMTTVSTGFASSAFGVSTANTRLFAHELGHIMGLHHDRYVVCNGSRCEAAAFPYAYGYHHCDETSFTDRWRTIMAYADQCSTWRTPHLFSNPERTYRGDPLGIAGLAPSTVLDGPSDAVRALNRTRAYVAKFRQAPDITVSFGAGSYTATEGGTAATVTVELSEVPTRPIDIPLTVAGTGATAYDYTGVPASVRFSRYVTKKTFTVTAVNDTADDDGESVTLTFGTPLPRNVTVGSTSTTTITLTDNDTVTAAPSILSVELTSDPGSDKIYALNDEIEASVRFNKTVTVTGEPQLSLRVGTLTHAATYRDSAGEVVRFVYTVADGDSDDDGVSIDADSLLLNGGTIQDGANQDADRTHSAVTANRNHRVDASSPVLQSAQANLTELILTYNESLDETATPPTSAFTVRVDGVGHGSVVAVAVDGSEVTLTLSRAVSYGEDGATISYTPGTPPLQDRLGNPAAAVSNQTVTSEMPPYDTDTDGLIEISNVTQLNAMRYDLDGDGDPSASGATTYSAAFPDASPPLRCFGGCMGYELAADLDFDAEGKWNSGLGWEPIGQFFTGFDTTFEGNGHTIANLYINRPFSSSITPALFSDTTSSAVIRNVGLVWVDVTSSRSINGFGAGLVGHNRGTIRACYATGQVRGGKVGGLVSSNSGALLGNYTAVRVTGQSRHAGGLAGSNSGTITNSYATGWASGIVAGGLVGTNSGTIIGSYTAGLASGDTTGGLVGANTGRVMASSWDTTTSGITTSAGGTGRTTTELQATTGSTTTWDHGTASQYSALRGKGDWKDFGYQLRAGPSLTATGSATRVVLTWTAVDVSHWNPAPTVTYTVYRNTGTTISMVAQNVSGLQHTTTGATDTYQIAAVVNGGETVRSGWTAVVLAPNQAPTFPSTEDGARSVAENTRANVDIGDPVAATDVDGDTLTYSLSGTDAASFTINTSTGQLRTQAALDHETKDSYSVTVSVHDGTPDTTVDATINVTITVTDVNEVPTFDDGTSTTRSVAENTPRDQAVGVPVAATDPDTATYADLSYRLSGTDAGVFLIDSDTGQVQTREPLDYETKRSYQVTVHVRDGKNAAGMDDSADDDHGHEPERSGDGHVLVEPTAGEADVDGHGERPRWDYGLRHLAVGAGHYPHRHRHPHLRGDIQPVHPTDGRCRAVPAGHGHLHRRHRHRADRDDDHDRPCAGRAAGLPDPVFALNHGEGRGQHGDGDIGPGRERRDAGDDLGYSSESGGGRRLHVEQ